MARKKAEPETKPEKKEKATQPEYKWDEGKPERAGLYNARVDGREMPLHFKVCQFTHRSYWMYVDGTDVNPSAKVEWREGRVEL